MCSRCFYLEYLAEQTQSRGINLQSEAVALFEDCAGKCTTLNQLNCIQG